MEYIPYKICIEGGSAEITEKKSRFIAHTFPIRTEQEAYFSIEGVRKRYWDARHHCYAFICGEGGLLRRCSDDGEPAKTAGVPMLDVLLAGNLRDICVVVTRYFGGVLLGTGGLVRAYQAAAIAGLEASRLLERQKGVRMQLHTDYEIFGKLRYMMEQEGIGLLKLEYAENIRLELVMEEKKKEGFLKKLSELSAGRLVPERCSEVFYAEDDRQIRLLS